MRRLPATYTAPVDDLRFVLQELHGAGQRFQELPAFEASDDPIDAILEEAAKVCENELFPCNQNGDEQGAQFDNGKVTLPDGYADAYKALTEGGWTAPPATPSMVARGCRRR